MVKYFIPIPISAKKYSIKIILFQYYFVTRGSLWLCFVLQQILTYYKSKKKHQIYLQMRCTSQVLNTSKFFCLFYYYSELTLVRTSKWGPFSSALTEIRIKLFRITWGKLYCPLYPGIHLKQRCSNESPLSYYYFFFLDKTFM